MASLIENKGIEELKRLTAELEKRFEVLRGRL